MLLICYWTVLAFSMYYIFMVCLATYLQMGVCKDCLEEVLFSSKTPYQMIENLELDVDKPKQCVAVQINMVHRHGHRLPSYRDVKGMDELAKIIPWKNPFSASTDKLLTRVGEHELFNLGKRIKIRFPELFVEPYSPLKYMFESSCKLRCTHSSNALAAGLFEHQGTLGDALYQPVALKVESCTTDKVLRFFDLCEKYLKEVVENNSATIELEKFGNGPEMKTVIDKLSAKLQVVLTVNHVTSMFLVCAYDIGMFNGSLDDGICSIFNEADRKILEYYMDLKHFYKRSAGHAINYKSSCPLLVNILSTLQLAANQATFPTAIFRSAHAETLMPLYALMGIYLDADKLSADNYHQMMNRKFRPACMSSFSGHIYFVLYKCSNGFKIQTYVNERLIKLPCCESELECDFDVFLNCYRHIVESCYFSRMCKVNRTKHEL